ncbi:MAG: hypothetical protein QOF42_2851, partial [Gammaproteobacteria bacterium]|nr:hypothetical protein [Gammaproteobacteria bacterium]
MSAKLLRAAALMLLSLMACMAQAREKTYTRNEVTAIIRDGRKIVSPSGVEELIEIPVGGTKQWISVRGRDR